MVNHNVTHQADERSPEVAEEDLMLFGPIFGLPTIVVVAIVVLWWIAYDRGWVKESLGMLQAQGVAILGIICALVIVALSMWNFVRGSREENWPVVRGTIQDTRIVADHAFETKWGGQLTWKAEYMVAYSVEGLEYAAWADSGIRGESEAAVRLVLPQSHPSCRVQYNPQKPVVSIAGCR